MGIPGAGKSRTAERFVADGYDRLNRDERGGTLGDIAAALDDTLQGGGTRVVLDNTYLTRAQRSLVVETAARHGVPVSCVWIDTPLAQAQVNMVERLLDRFGSLPSPEELRNLARSEPGLAHADVPDACCTRARRAGRGRRVRTHRTDCFRAQRAVRNPWSVRRRIRTRHVQTRVGRAAPRLRLASRRAGPSEHAVCTHPGGPPVCWCRPPLPGLLLDFARRNGIAPERSIVVGNSSTHRTLARTLGATFVDPSGAVPPPL